MKSKYFWVLLFGVLATVLMVGNLLPIPMVSDETYLAYALGRRPPSPPHHPDPPRPPDPVPEPSTLVLIGGGLSGVGTYLYYKHKGRRK